MMKLFLILFLFVSAGAFAASSNKNDGDLTAAVKFASKSLNYVNTSTVQKPPCDIPRNPPVPLADEFALKGVRDGCDRFLNDKGEAGEWGNVILNKMNSLPKEKMNQSFLSNNIPDMPLVCPRFNEFSNELKKKFWIWTFASIAWEESSCNPKASAAGVNSRAIGLLQLEDSLRLRQARGPSCKVPSVTAPQNNLACGVDMLSDQLLGNRSGFFRGTSATGELFWKSSYWLKLRLKAKTPQLLEAKKKELIQSLEVDSQKPNIKTLVMSFPYCR